MLTCLGGHTSRTAGLEPASSWRSQGTGGRQPQAPGPPGWAARGRGSRQWASGLLCPPPPPPGTSLTCWAVRTYRWWPLLSTSRSGLMAEPGGPTCWEWYTWPWEPLRKTWRDDKACSQDLGYVPCSWLGLAGSLLCHRASFPSCYTREARLGHRGWGRPQASCMATLPSPICHHPATLGKDLSARAGGQLQGAKQGRRGQGLASERLLGPDWLWDQALSTPTLWHPCPT